MRTHNTQLRLVSVAAAALLAATGLGIGLAEPASAATSAVNQCWGKVDRSLQTGGTAKVPAHRTSTNCWLDTDQMYYNAAVEALQYGLRWGENRTSIAIDGYYGPGTKETVRAIQKKYKLSPDGVYGPATGSHMLWYSSNGTSGKWN